MQTLYWYWYSFIGAGRLPSCICVWCDAFYSPEKSLHKRIEIQERWSDDFHKPVRMCWWGAKGRQRLVSSYLWWSSDKTLPDTMIQLVQFLESKNHNIAPIKSDTHNNAVLRSKKCSLLSLRRMYDSSKENKTIKHPWSNWSVFKHFNPRKLKMKMLSTFKA